MTTYLVVQCKLSSVAGGGSEGDDGARTVQPIKKVPPEAMKVV